MVSQGSVRPLNRKKFQQCVRLRKQGLSYREIQKILPIAKSTLQGWLTLAGLTLSKEHLQIQFKKRIENRRVATEASRLTRQRKVYEQIQLFLERVRNELPDSTLVGGCLLYEAEGQKLGECKLSNSDYRLINYFLKFIEKYFGRNKSDGFIFRLYIHKNREKDLDRILDFWSSRLAIPRAKIAVTWKKHRAKLRTNRDYVGQMSILVRRSSIINRQIRAVSDIILRE